MITGVHMMIACKMPRKLRSTPVVVEINDTILGVIIFAPNHLQNWRIITASCLAVNWFTVIMYGFFNGSLRFDVRQTIGISLCTTDSIPIVRTIIYLINSKTKGLPVTLSIIKINGVDNSAQSHVSRNAHSHSRRNGS